MEKVLTPSRRFEAAVSFNVEEVTVGVQVLNTCCSTLVNLTTIFLVSLTLSFR